MDDAAMLSFCREQAARFGGAGFYADMARKGPARWTLPMRAAIQRGAEKASAAAAARPDAEALTDAAGFAGIIALFDRLRQKLKRPAVLLHAEGVGTIRLSVAGPNARVPGSLNVAEAKQFGEGVWFGRVLQSGAFEPSGRAEVPAGVREALAAFSADPARKAAADGKLRGACSFCSLPLSDERSLAVGYGPKCASNAGLPWGEKVADPGALLCAAA